MKILVAEDEAMPRKLLDFSLRKNGYATLLAADGHEALALLEMHDDIGLVIADVVMPDVDGIELLAEMKANPQWAKIPVIVATVMAELETVRMAAKLGCTRYLVKPISEDDLVRSVRFALGQGAAAEKNAAAEADATAAELPGEKAAATAARLLPTKIDVLKRLILGQIAHSRAVSLFELSKPCTQMGATAVSSLLDQLATHLAKKDRIALVDDYFALLRELTIMQVSLKDSGLAQAASGSSGKPAAR